MIFRNLSFILTANFLKTQLWLNFQLSWLQWHITTDSGQFTNEAICFSLFFFKHMWAYIAISWNNLFPNSSLKKECSHTWALLSVLFSVYIICAVHLGEFKSKCFIKCSLNPVVKLRLQLIFEGWLEELCSGFFLLQP